MEFVYVVKRTDLFGGEDPQGFLTAAGHGDAVQNWLECARERGFFVERRHAEEDPSFKQVIPYTVVLRGDEVLLLRRSRRGGDARLHDKLSIGVGGHVNPPDAVSGDPIASCALREIDEELILPQPVTPVLVGVLNDDSNAVGSVHFGAVHVAVLESGEVSVRETELLSAEFISIDRLAALAADAGANLETWSRLIAARIDELRG